MILLIAENNPLPFKNSRVYGSYRAEPGLLKTPKKVVNMSSAIQIRHSKYLPDGSRAPKRSRYAGMSIGSYFIAAGEDAKRLANSCYKYFQYNGGQVQQESLEDGRLRVTRIA